MNLYFVQEQKCISFCFYLKFVNILCSSSSHCNIPLIHVSNVQLLVLQSPCIWCSRRDKNSALSWNVELNLCCDTFCPLCYFVPSQALWERGDQAILRKPVLSVQHEVHHCPDGHVRRPPGLALQTEPRWEGRQQEDHAPALVLHSQGKNTHISWPFKEDEGLTGLGICRSRGSYETP